MNITNNNMKDVATVGKITKVKWHYRRVKYFRNTYGHVSESYNKDYYTERKNRQWGTKIIEPNAKYSMMNPKKNYAFVSIDMKNDNPNKYKFLIRNLFNSNDPKEFKQKNTYNWDCMETDLFLDDPNNLIEKYLRLGNESFGKTDVLYVCVEYEIIIKNEKDLSLYCDELLCNDIPTDNIRIQSKGCYSFLRRFLGRNK